MRMGLGRRLALQVAAAVALAIAAAAAVTYVVVRGQLRGGLDETLTDRVEVAQFVPADAAAPFIEALPPPPRRAPRPRGDLGGLPAEVGQHARGEILPVPGPPGPGPAHTLAPLLALPPGDIGGPEILTQVVDSNGDARAATREASAIPVESRDVAVARGESSRIFSDRRIDGVPVRVLTSAVGPGTAVQVARPLTEVDDATSDLLTVLVLVTIGGTGAAALIGLAVGRRAMRPVRELTEAAEEVAATHDLARRIEGPGDGDEVDRLRVGFNRMLAALERSVEAQRSLVADASHELRTPLTTLRTNIELLERAPEIGPSERTRIVADVDAELIELGRLVDDVVELAREGSEELDLHDVRLDEVVAAAVERARRRSSDTVFDCRLEPTVVRGDGDRLDRAVSNLLDNAVEWSPARGLVEVELTDGVISVRDGGEGIPAEDLPRVFDRFYRAAAARGRPGSGLGLAIVQRIAEQHGGTVVAANSPEGGAELRLSLPIEGSD